MKKIIPKIIQLDKIYNFIVDFSHLKSMDANTEYKFLDIFQKANFR